MPEPSTKKRKQTSTEAHVELPAKKAKKEKREKKDKGKAKDTEFHVVKTSLIVSIPPVFAGNPRAGVEEMLDSMVMRYIPALQGVVLSHSNLRFLNDKATVKYDCPYLNCSVEFDATVWSPRVGMKLVGKVNLCSPDHVSLLLHRTFNVSIPRHHIPKGEWEFEYGPAENDPEFGPEASAEADVTEEGTTGQAEGGGGGKWVHHSTNEKLGGSDGYLEFTVIGLTIANEMLSLLGSLQEDPFSPEHRPESGAAAKTESEMDDIEVQHEVEPKEDEEEEEGDSDDDTFKTLGKMTDEVAVAEAAKRAAEAAALAEKEKKRKRKAEKAEGKKQKRMKS
ncbi:putative SHS2 domain found in N terminus of Rpb7p/Rpc25p/MJ0397 [Lyophyllum shimeji]|uniref:SHS2 domain found in N terminus of Rpb7p/Rpc25p/MJ0397 n=1 Tax=Lyophyllum shimeji TaxID=47721 RepID=A0A9P3UMU1_LYOSH|nr:putative SHS2 domain found in N terminus of Rpb7p/Rpc25p/MJ0397 [Lyophyllum shimeji]